MAPWHYSAAILLWLLCQRTLAVPATSSELLASVSVPSFTQSPAVALTTTAKPTARPSSRVRTSSSSSSSSVSSSVPETAQTSSRTESDYVTATFTVRAERSLRHLVVDRRSGKVLVGATNAVFQLGADLSPDNERVTGPKLDSPLCFSDSCQEHEKKATDNHNKVLLVDYDHDKVIACGSVYQGACERLSVSNISRSDELIRVAVAANDDASSTVAFIGPQRYLMANEARVLYVGATFNKNGPYRDLVPAIASRHLQTFDLADKGFSNNPKVEIESNLRDYFRVRYLYGFHAGEHAYFVTVQRKSHLQSNEEEGYVTRLARVCVSDSTYNTYTEVTVQCLGASPSSSSSSSSSSSQEPLVYNLAEAVTLVEAGAELAQALRVSVGDLVLVGAFARSVNHTADTWPHAALCAFTLTDVEHKFSENIHLCLNGSVQSRSMDYVAGNQGHCPAAGESGNIYNFCDASLKISGTVPLKSMAAAIFPNTTATAMAANVVDPHTVVFMATKNGSVRKILLQSASMAAEYEDVPVAPGQPILGDMAFDVNGDSLYLMTSLKVMRLKVENCLRYSSCSACIGAKDPYCGWCSLERRCTVKSTCQNASRHEVSASPPRWLSLGSQCIDFQEVRPNMVTITDMKMVELTIHELPSGPKYLCVFGVSQPTEATFTATGLRCLTPAPSTRPKILPGQDHVIVPLAVRSSETNTDFVSRDFIFFDCSKHTTCKSCTNSRWSCSWCIYENFCTTNASSCRRAVASALFKNPSPVAMSGGPRSARPSASAAQCPRFGNTANILIPHEVEKEIEVPVLDLPTPQPGHEGFHCILEIEGAKAEVKARIEGDKVICEQRMYTYQLQVGELKVNLTVVWNGDHHIDTTEVILYKCRILGSHHLRDDCSLCTIQHRKYGCGWCNNACSYKHSCPSPPSDTCPEPRIDVIRPLSAPIEGGTLVTIEGGNLGSRIEDVRRNVTIGDIPCELVDYNVSVRIVCRAGPSPGGEINAALKVGNRRNYTVSTEKFSYKNVSVFDVSPNVGPVAGGTTLTIRGNNLNVGSFLNVTLDGLPCRIDRFVTSSGQITCRTTRSPTGPHAISKLIVVLDGATRIIHKPFTYVEDPTVFRIYPTETFASGGRRITVEGTNFLSVQNPKMVVFSRNQSIGESICQVVNNSVMDCPSPAVDVTSLGSLDDQDAPKIRGKRWRLRRASNPGPGGNGPSPTVRLRVRVGFVMDEVPTVANLTKNFPHVTSELVYVDDPKFFPFAKNRVKLYKGDTLVIEGVNLKLASDERDVNVTIGMKPCNVTSLAMAQLVCTPPTDQPRGTDETGKTTDTGLPAVVVRVGNNLRFPIGYLRYEVIKTYEFPKAAIGGIATGGALLIILSVAILIIYRRKSTQAEREYKRIQIQMDTLESNVRSECKQAFAELQTDMTDLTSDLEATGIPSLDHPTYVMKVFFPGVSGHPILSDPKMRCGIVRSNYDAAMLQFEQLLSNKNFLLAFIETLESQKSFSIRDKVSVASLLMVILMNKMEYATDVLKSLLLRLIDKSVCTKHPQLMLRRTESVVEKMLTNWMALCMYNYLKDYAGSSLFLLVKAIAHQVEKGPVDNVTHDARYSLSEERLLREPIQHSFVTIQVIQEDLDEKAQCKVLDCDTIGQVKSKILDALHKNTPYSLRPSIDEVDLEWRHGRGGHLTLQDEDLTTKTINGWKQLNTLAHYGVKESAVMSLIAKQNESFNSNCTGNYSLNSVSPFVNGDIEHGVKVYHLVKSVDDHQYHTNNKERIHKAIPEIFLTRLLSTKGTVQKFVDDFFSTVLTANEALPPAIKWLFDTFDEGARRHGISDPEVVHAWKSNSLPLRFWVNFIKNPDFVFDIHKTPTVDACLSVIAQTFMDSCSTSEHRLGKDSPSNKLLFAKDIPHYKDMVTRFYMDIQQMPQITDQEMNSAMQQLSMAHMGEFDTVTALKELYIYATKYDEDILEALETDPHCKRLHLAHKLENVACTLDGEETSTC